MDLLQSKHEFSWKDLKNEYESPSWHKDALLTTEKRRAEGKEQAIDWNEAKKLLRKEFE